MKTQAHDESRAPPDKVRALHCLLPIEFHGFTSRIDFKGFSLWFRSYLNLFRDGDGMGPFKIVLPVKGQCNISLQGDLFCCYKKFHLHMKQVFILIDPK